MAPSRRPPEPPPDFLIDRSLGKHLLPRALRGLGFTVRTLADVYGEAKAEVVEDQEWIKDAGDNDWVVLTKDDAIRRRPAEFEAFEIAELRVFCLTNAGLRGAEQTERFIGNIHRIVQRSRKPGPFIYGGYEGRIEQIWATGVSRRHQ